MLTAAGADCALAYAGGAVISAVFQGELELEGTLLKAGQMARMDASGQVQVNPPGLNRDAQPPALLPEQ